MTLLEDILCERMISKGLMTTADYFSANDRVDNPDDTYIYAMSSEDYISRNTVFLGYTRNPQKTIDRFVSDCPPVQRYTLGFVYLWKTNSDDIEKDLEIIHDHFRVYRLMRHVLGDTNWFKLEDDVKKTLETFASNHKWEVRNWKDEKYGVVL